MLDVKGCSIACHVTQLIYINPVGEGVTPEGLQIIPTVVRTPCSPILQSSIRMVIT